MMKKVCKICAKEFETDSKNQIYCSESCNRKAYNIRHYNKEQMGNSLYCAMCGKAKEPERATYRFKYCKKCRDISHAASVKKTYTKTYKEKACISCGKAFTTSRKNKQYCSNACKFYAYGKTPADKSNSKIKPHPKMSLVEINTMAREEGLTYAQYVTKYKL